MLVVGVHQCIRNVHELAIENRERPDFTDIALVYALINFIGTVAVLKFFEYAADGPAVDEHSGGR